MTTPLNEAQKIARGRAEKAMKVQAALSSAAINAAICSEVWFHRTDDCSLHYKAMAYKVRKAAEALGFVIAYGPDDVYGYPAERIEAKP